eukprot:GHVT01032935.1.p1 GENE.GHVT01032935.1~~GHVT01032935.1.p1  ORF type:complete len:143 (-),score=5.29 GHVT01032935.1:102-491(-)
MAPASELQALKHHALIPYPFGSAMKQMLHRLQPQLLTGGHKCTYTLCLRCWECVYCSRCQRPADVATCFTTRFRRVCIYTSKDGCWGPAKVELDEHGNESNCAKLVITWPASTKKKVKCLKKALERILT